MQKDKVEYLQSPCKLAVGSKLATVQAVSGLFSMLLPFYAFEVEAEQREADGIDYMVFILRTNMLN